MGDLPKGTVTFLFTDLEGSTRLWEANPDAMKSALARHDEILRASVTANAGVVVKTTGDGVHAVFSSAPDALSAAHDSQLALAREAWPTRDPLRVRMGVHSGDAQRRDGDYYGPTLNRAARLMAASHGGQVVVSLATEQLVRDNLPRSTKLAYLGEHRLRDLARGERVFQLVADGLVREFPALRSVDARPTNLPVQLTSFVGRHSELGTLSELLNEARLVSLIGPGGCGKTRLALQVGADALERFADGVWFVDLSGLRDAALVAQTVATTLGLREEAGRSSLESLLDHLGARALLVLLDNCEHLVEACAELTDGLLRGCPSLRVIATSREPLGVAGEVAWRVPSLSVPSRDASTGEVVAGAYGAVRLFYDRAERARPGFHATDEVADVVAEICRRLDGIPLAIELAAARVRLLGVEEIMSGLANRLRLLGGGPRTAVPRHQTIAASIEWSHDLLGESERVMFRRASVFADGFDLAAAEAVCAGGPIEAHEVLDVLGALVDRSLVTVDDEFGVGRFRLLETIRQYAADQLARAEETAAVRGRHLAHYLAFAERAAPELEGSEQRAWLDRLAVDHNNLRSALDWSLTDDQIESGLRLATAAHYFWYVRGHFSEGAHWFDQFFEVGGPVTSELRARALYAVSYLTGWGLGRFDVVIPGLEECLELAREAGDKRAAGRALFALGMVLTTQQPAAAAAVFEEAVEMGRLAGDTWCSSFASCHLAFARFLAEGGAQVSAEFAEAFTAAQRGNHVEVLAETLGMSGAVSVMLGDYETGERNLTECRALAIELDHQLWIPMATEWLGRIALRRGHYDKAVAIVDEAVTLAEASRNVLLVAMATGLRGESALAAGDPGAALAHFEAAVAAGREMTLPTYLVSWLGLAAEARLALGDLTGARIALDEAAQLVADVTLPLYEAQFLCLRGRLARQQGETETAQVALLGALQLFRDVGDPQGQADALEELAGTASERNDHQHAARLLGEAQAIRERIGYRRLPHRNVQHDVDQARIQAALSPDDFQRAFNDGAEVSVAAFPDGPARRTPDDSSVSPREPRAR